MLYLFKKEDFNYSLKHNPKLTLMGLIVFLLSILLFFVYSFVGIQKYNNLELRLLDVIFIIIFSFFSIFIMAFFYEIHTSEKINTLTGSQNISYYLSYEYQLKILPYACLYYLFALNTLILYLMY